MNLSKEMRAALVSEIQFIAKKMRTATNPLDKVYYLSAVFAMAQRILNFEYDPELAFIYQVTNLTYNAINARLVSMAQRSEGGATLPENALGKLEGDLDALAHRIAKGEPTYDILQDMSNIAYSATGNGYYLMQKGLLKI